MIVMIHFDSVYEKETNQNTFIGYKWKQIQTDKNRNKVKW